MKPKSTFNAFIISALALFGSASSAYSEVLLTIDIANAEGSGIVITATNGVSAVTNSAFTNSDGITLADFWDTGEDTFWNQNWTVDVLSNLGVTGSLVTWTEADSDSSSNGKVFDNVNMADFALFKGVDGATPMSLVTGSVAFTGSMTLPAALAINNPSFSWSRLRSADTIGNIYLGFYSNPGPLLGQYEIINSAIPEPSAYAALAGLATLGFAALRRPRRASADNLS